jgi:AcrR family transcriptional regulator
VEAICEATIQVLLSVGKERLTTTKVAARAGVSVGTLYQYFPNKSSLLQAVLRKHMEEVTRAVEAVCATQRAAELEQMANGLVEAFLAAKLRHVEASKALYYVSDDVGGAEIVRQLGVRGIKAVAEMLESSGARFSEDVQVMAATVMAAMSGVSRRMLEASKVPETLASMRDGLQVMVRAYVNACVVSAGASSAKTAVSALS